MKNTVRSLLLIATGVVAGAAIALGVERFVGKAGEECAKGDSVAVAPAAASLDTVREIRSLDELFAIDPRDTVIGSCNLSHLGLKVLPDLSQYTIRRLDLSHNDIHLISEYEDYKNFPQGLEDLSLAYNRVNVLHFPNGLKRLDVSHNEIECGGFWLIGEDDPRGCGFNPVRPLEKMNLRYLDISYNWNMHYELHFAVDSIDTLIRVHAAKGYKLFEMRPMILSSGGQLDGIRNGFPKIISWRDTIIRKK